LADAQKKERATSCGYGGLILVQGGEVKRRARVHTSGLTSEIPRQMHPNHGSEYLPWLYGAIAAAAAAAVAEVHATTHATQLCLWAVLVFTAQNQ
jgi:hypothetical protein